MPECISAEASFKYRSPLRKAVFENDFLMFKNPDVKTRNMMFSYKACMRLY